MFIGLITATVALFALMSVPSVPARHSYRCWPSAESLSPVGPYSYLGGAFALDFGGKQGSAVASGMIMESAISAASVAGTSVTQISKPRLVQACVALAAVTALAAIGAGFLTRCDSEPPQSNKQAQ